MFTLIFWRETFERAVKSLAQATILGLGAAEVFNLFTTDWQSLLGFALGGAVLSALTSVSSVAITGNDSPNLVV